MRTNVALSMSSSAIALFSCKVTHAVFESSDTVMYSGSRSCATLAFGPKMRMLGSSDVPLKAVKSDGGDIGLRQRGDDVWQPDDADAAFGIVPRGHIRAGFTFVGDQHRAPVRREREHVRQRANRDDRELIAIGVEERHFAVGGLRAASTATATTPFRTETLLTMAPY